MTQDIFLGSGVDVYSTHESATRSHVAHLAVGSLGEGSLTGRAHAKAFGLVLAIIV